MPGRWLGGSLALPIVGTAQMHGIWRQEALASATLEHRWRGACQGGGSAGASPSRSLVSLNAGRARLGGEAPAEPIPRISVGHRWRGACAGRWLGGSLALPVVGPAQCTEYGGMRPWERDAPGGRGSCRANSAPFRRTPVAGRMRRPVARREPRPPGRWSRSMHGMWRQEALGGRRSGRARLLPSQIRAFPSDTGGRAHDRAVARREPRPPDRWYRSMHEYGGRRPWERDAPGGRGSWEGEAPAEPIPRISVEHRWRGA